MVYEVIMARNPTLVEFLIYSGDFDSDPIERLTLEVSSELVAVVIKESERYTANMSSKVEWYKGPQIVVVGNRNIFHDEKSFFQDVDDLFQRISHDSSGRIMPIKDAYLSAIGALFQGHDTRFYVRLDSGGEDLIYLPRSPIQA